MNEATTRAWWDDLRGYSLEAIRSAWIEHRRVNSYFPYTSDLLKFLTFQPEVPTEYRGLTAQEIAEAEEAKGSPEALAFQELLNKVINGTKLEEVERNAHEAKVRAQANEVKA